MKIIYKPIDEIIPYENNPRHNRRTIEKLKELISSHEVEFNVPLVIDKEGVIVKGHSRWNALKELGYTIAPVIVSENSDEINNEDRLQDNIVQELSSWKEDELTIEVRETGIDISEYDIEIATMSYGDVVHEAVTGQDFEKAEAKFLGNEQDELDFIEINFDCFGQVFMVDRNDVKKYG